MEVGCPEDAAAQSLLSGKTFSLFDLKNWREIVLKVQLLEQSFLNELPWHICVSQTASQNVAK